MLFFFVIVVHFGRLPPPPSPVNWSRFPHHLDVSSRNTSLWTITDQEIPWINALLLPAQIQLRDWLHGWDDSILLMVFWGVI